MQVQTLRAEGGGDTPEDILPALDKAASLDWSSKARFLLLIADAPCHGRDCNDEPDDKYPQVHIGAGLCVLVACFLLRLGEDSCSLA